MLRFIVRSIKARHILVGVASVTEKESLLIKSILGMCRTEEIIDGKMVYSACNGLYPGIPPLVLGVLQSVPHHIASVSLDIKVIVSLNVPEIDQTFDVYLPVNKKIGNIINLLNQAINELTDNTFPKSNINVLYNVTHSF